MTYLLDTHVLVWAFTEPERLSKRARSLLTEPSHTFLVSSASAFEIATKHRLGKLDVAREVAAGLPTHIAQYGFAELPITIQHAQRAGEWTQPHKDPFDRILAAQSAIEDVPLVTADPAIAAFGIRTVW